MFVRLVLKRWRKPVHCLCTV